MLSLSVVSSLLASVKLKRVVLAVQAAHQCSASDPSKPLLPSASTSRASFQSFLPDPDRPVERPVRADPKEKNRAALDLLKKNFPSTATSRDKKATTKTSANPVLALRLLKQRAKPADPKKPDLALDSRLYIHVQTPEDAQGTPLWIDKVGALIEVCPPRPKLNGSVSLRIRAQAKHLMCWHFDCKSLIPTPLYRLIILRCVIT